MEWFWTFANKSNDATNNTTNNESNDDSTNASDEYISTSAQPGGANDEPNKPDNWDADNESNVSSTDDEAKLDGNQNESKSRNQKHKVRTDKNGGIYANIRGLYPKSNQSKVPYLEDLALFQI